MKKIRLNNVTAYFIGQITLTLGIVLSVKARFGISVATSPSFVLNKIVSPISFGTMNYLYQGFVFLLMLLIIREIKLRYFLSFLTAVIFGYIIDLWGFILRGFTPDTPVQRLTVFFLSVSLMAFAISTFVISGLPLLPFDIFVRKISEKFGFSFGRVKLIFDLSNLALAVALGLIFFGKLVGVWWGTLFFAVVLGPFIGFILKQYKKHVEISGRLPAFLVESEIAS